MNRWVLDTNIVVSGLLWSGAPRRLMTFGRDSGISFYTSDAIISELRNTLNYAKFDPKFTEHGFMCEQAIDAYVDICTVVTPAPLRALAPDPDDDWVIATAVAANADLIVTGDKPFLTMKGVDGIRIVTTNDALAELSADPQLTMRKL